MNKKRTYQIILLLFALIIIASNINALGIAPSKKIIAYDTEEHLISVKIVNTEAKDVTLKISAEGQLAYSVTIPEPIINIRSYESEKELTYIIKLPQDLTPGSNIIVIKIEEINDDSKVNTVSGLLSLSHQLIINVPYTGLYAEGFLSTAPTTNPEETVAAITITNRGAENIDAITGSLNIRDLNGELIYTKNVQEKNNLAPGFSIKIEETFNIKKTGIYIVEYDITYDNKKIILNKAVNIGEYDLTITGASVKNFKLGTIAKLDVDVSNNWNVPVEDAYGEIIVTDLNGTIVGKANTTQTTIDPKTGKITVYWDTTNIRAGQYVLNLKLYAGDKVVTQSYQSTINNDKFIIGIQEETKKTNYVIIMILIILAITFAALLFRRRNKKVYK